MTRAPATSIKTVANHYASQLQLCTSRNRTSGLLATSIHAHMITSGFKPRNHLLNRLIDVYSKSSKLSYANHLFDQMPEPDIVSRTTLIAAYSLSGKIHLAKEVFRKTPVRIQDTVFYNAMITAYSHNNDGHAAVELFCHMRQNDFKPDLFTFTSVLGALALVVEEETQCQQIHCAVVKSGAGSVTSVLNALVSVYIRCASAPLVSLSQPSLMITARKLFDEIPVKDELSWTMIVSGYVKIGDLDEACQLLDEIPEKLGVAWNALISGYFHKELYEEGLKMFRKMLFLGIQLDEFTYTSLVSGCANAGFFSFGKELHAHILKTVYNPSPDFSLPVNNAIATLYCRCEKVNKARNIFNTMPVRDVVSWNALLSGYMNVRQIDEARSLFTQMAQKNNLTWNIMISGLAQNGFGEESLKLFNDMKFFGFEPCDYAFAGAITSCAVLGSLHHGTQLHAQLVHYGFESSLSAMNSLITMYARCGVVDSAHLVFITMPYIDSVSWNAMIAALGQHGRGPQAIKLYEEMLMAGIEPDRITFLTVLSACSHAGLVSEGRKYFDSMKTLYGIQPGEDHYARFVDLLCRAGKFSEAKDVIQSMPHKPGVPIWEALLAGCRIHKNIDLGTEAAERLFEMIPQHDGTYILLSNIYAVMGHWEKVAEVRKLMRDRGVKKEPGCSWIDVENKVHVFLVDDALHPEVQEIYDFLEKIESEMKKLGFVAEMDLDQKGYRLSTAIHSEKLAVAYGLMKLPFGAPVRVFKNLRICGDCHNAFKFICKVAQREIVVRDGKRFHHFRDGKCSCGDYW